MTRFSKFLLCTCVIAAVTVAVSISSCNKDNTSSVGRQKQLDETSISSLVDKMYTVSDPSGDAAITKEYQSLNAEQFAIFTRLQEERELAKAEKDSSGTKAAILSALTLAKNFRTEMDKLAVDKFGVHANKLSVEQVKGITSEARKNLQSKITGGIAQNAKSDVGILACPLRSYNQSAACHSDARGRGRYYWENVINTSGEWPCDSEHRFDGWYFSIHGVDYASRQAILWYGCLGRRIYYYSDGVDTMVILGFGGMAFWLGYEGYFNAEML